MTQNKSFTLPHPKTLKDKTLVNKTTILNIGDIIVETDRFGRDFTYYKIVGEENGWYKYLRLYDPKYPLPKIVNADKETTHMTHLFYLTYKVNGVIQTLYGANT